MSFLYLVMSSFLLIAATLAKGGWLDLTPQGLAPCKKHQVRLAHNGLELSRPASQA